jgi:hypothetical protein
LPSHLRRDSGFSPVSEVMSCSPVTVARLRRIHTDFPILPELPCSDHPVKTFYVTSLFYSIGIGSPECQIALPILMPEDEAPPRRTGACCSEELGPVESRELREDLCRLPDEPASLLRVAPCHNCRKKHVLLNARGDRSPPLLILLLSFFLSFLSFSACV